MVATIAAAVGKSMVEAMKETSNGPRGQDTAEKQTKEEGKTYNK